MDYRKFRRDKLVGLGEFEALRRKDEDDKPSKYYLTLSKWKSSLTFRITEAQYAEWVVMEKAGELSIIANVVISYVAIVTAKADAVHIAKQNARDLNFVGNSLDEPWLHSYELIPVEDEEDGF